MNHTESTCCKHCWSDGRFTDVGCVKPTCECHNKEQIRKWRDCVNKERKEQVGKKCATFTEACYNHPQCMATLSPTGESWEPTKEFEKFWTERGFGSPEIHDAVKTWMFFTLAAREQALRGEIEKRIGATRRTKMFLKSYDDGHDAALTSMLLLLDNKDDK